MEDRDREKEALCCISVSLISGFLLNPQWSSLHGSISLEVEMEELQEFTLSFTSKVWQQGHCSGLEGQQQGAEVTEVDMPVTEQPPLSKWPVETYLFRKAPKPRSVSNNKSQIIGKTPWQADAEQTVFQMSWLTYRWRFLTGSQRVHQRWF